MCPIKNTKDEEILQLPKLYEYITTTLIPKLLTEKLSTAEVSRLAENLSLREDLFATLNIIQTDIKRAYVELPIIETNGDSNAIERATSALRSLEEQRSELVRAIQILYPNPNAQLQDKYPRFRFLFRKPKNEDGTWAMPTTLYTNPTNGGMLRLGSRPFEGACLQSFTELPENAGKKILIVNLMTPQESFDEQGKPITFQGNRMVTAETALPPGVERIAYPYQDHGPLIQPQTGESITPEELYQRIFAIYDAVQKGKQVWLHCWSGIERSAAHAALAYCMLEQKTLFEAMEHINSERAITKSIDKYPIGSQKILINTFFHMLEQNPNNHLAAFEQKDINEKMRHLDLFFARNNAEEINAFAVQHPKIKDCISKTINSLTKDQLKALQNQYPQLIPAIQNTCFKIMDADKLPPLLPDSEGFLAKTWRLLKYLFSDKNALKAGAKSGVAVATTATAMAGPAGIVVGAGTGVITMLISAFGNSRSKYRYVKPGDEEKQPLISKLTATTATAPEKRNPEELVSTTSEKTTEQKLSCIF